MSDTDTTKDASEAAELSADWRFRALGRDWMGLEINCLPTGRVTLTADEVVTAPPPADKELADEAPAPEPPSDERLRSNAMIGDIEELSRDELVAFQKWWREKDGNTPGYNLEKAHNYGRQAAEWKAKHESLLKRLGDEIKSSRLAASISKGRSEKMAMHLGAFTSLERVLAGEGDQ